MIASGAWISPTLVHIQSNLHRDLDLVSLSNRAGLSPAHFHRTFRKFTGETPRAYVERLRVERAAFQICIRETSLLTIALECGFQNQETFIRAFRRRYGQTPGAYKLRGALAGAEGRALDRTDGPAGAQPFVLSDTKVATLRALHLAFIRHVGSYESVSDGLYDELRQWARRRHIPAPLVWMGIGHDAPATTRASQLRFDAALVIPAAFSSGKRVSYQHLAGGEFAITTHTGPFATLPQAYATIFPRVLKLRGYRCVALPAIEIYHTAKVDALGLYNQTDICLPVIRK